MALKRKAKTTVTSKRYKNYKTVDNILDNKKLLSAKIMLVVR